MLVFCIDGHKEVKQRLQEFVLSKQQSMSSGSTPSTPTKSDHSQPSIFSPAQEIERESREANAKRPTQGERELTKRALRDPFPLRKTSLYINMK